MTILIKISAVALVFIFLSFLLKNNRNEFIFFMRIAVIVLIFFAIADSLSDFILSVMHMFSALDIDGLHIKSLVKVAGISIISDFICDILKDNNESSLSRVVEMCAKVFIIILCLPMINSLIAFCVEILNWMKKVLLIFIVIFIFLPFFNIESFAVDFNEESNELWSSLDDRTKEYLNELGIDEISMNDLFEITPLRAMKFLIKTATTTGSEILKKVVLIIAVLILTSVTISLLDKSSSIIEIIQFVSSLIIISMIIVSCVRILNDAVSAVKTTCIFVNAYLPVMCAAIIATRNPAMAFTYNSFTIFLSSVIATIADKVLVPIISCLLSFNILSSFSTENYRTRIVKTIKRLLIISLSFFSTIFTGILTTQSILASSTDSVMLKGIRFISGAFIPIVGGGVGDALSSVFSSFLIMKNTFGVFIIIAIILINLPVMLELLIWYFVLGFCSIVSSMLKLDNTTEIFDSLSSILSILNIIVFFITFTLVISTGVILIMRG